MRLLSASDLLEIWERGAGGTPVEQALIILATIFPQVPGDDLARLTISQRDAALFRLRELTFGSQLKGLADCPVCHERLELAFDAENLRSLDLLPKGEVSLPDHESTELFNAATSFQFEGYGITFRLPTSADLMSIASTTDIAQARQCLLNACILSVKRKRRTISVSDLPSNIVNSVLERIGQAASLANLTIAAICPACGHEWEIVFDIVSYFWSEINAWAVRIMHEIHALASNYGWREADILSMSAWRRQRYLELIGA